MMDQDFNYERAKERLDKLFNQDNIDMEIQCCYSVLYLMLYEHIKYMLTDQIISFLSDDIMDIDNPKKSKKYINFCKTAGGAFEYGFEFYQLDEDQRKVLKDAQGRRGKATHQFLHLFMNEEHFSFVELKRFYDIAKYIDNYWTVNVEVAISGDIDIENADLENAHSVYFLLISQIAQRIFPLEEAAKRASQAENLTKDSSKHN